MEYRKIIDTYLHESNAINRKSKSKHTVMAHGIRRQKERNSFGLEEALVHARSAYGLQEARHTY